MTITIDYVRKKYPKEYLDLSDEEVQRILDYMYFICNFTIDWQEKHPGENIIDHLKPNTQEK